MQPFCSGQAISVTFSGCVFVAMGIKRTLRMLHIVTCGLTGSSFPHYLINGMIFERKKEVINHAMCVLTLSTTFA